MIEKMYCKLGGRFGAVKVSSLGIYKILNIRKRQTDDRPALNKLVRSKTYMAGPYFLRDIGNRQIKLKKWFICELRPLSIISVKLTTSTSARKCTLKLEHNSLQNNVVSLYHESEKSTRQFTTIFKLSSSDGGFFFCFENCIKQPKHYELRGQSLVWF
ncbi:hypothetical protein LBYS11_16370 [Lysinibacillus sp. YS11]|nr:hypothetical protein LBYS11_16370 [Lysinibacillus sp. YS11]